MDCTCNWVAMWTTYSLVVATGAFQHLCSDRYTHVSTLKQTAVSDSIDLFTPMIPFSWHLPFAKLKLSISKGTWSFLPFFCWWTILRHGRITTHHERVTRLHVIDHMQLHAYLIRNWVPHVINNYVHLTVAILSGKKNEIVRQCYVLLTARHDSCVYMNRQLLDEAAV